MSMSATKDVVVEASSIGVGGMNNNNNESRIRTLVQRHLYVREVLNVEEEMGRVEELHAISFPLEYPREFYNELKEAVLYQQQVRQRVFPPQPTPPPHSGLDGAHAATDRDTTITEDNNQEGDITMTKESSSSLNGGGSSSAVTATSTTPTSINTIKCPNKNWILLVACLPAWVVRRVQKLRADSSNTCTLENSGLLSFTKRAPAPCYTLRPPPPPVPATADTDATTTKQHTNSSSKLLHPITALYSGDVYVDNNTFMMESTPQQEAYFCTNYPPIQDRDTTSSISSNDYNDDDDDEEEQDDDDNSGLSYIVGLITGADKRVPLQHSVGSVKGMSSWMAKGLATMLSGSIPTPVGYVSTIGVDPLLRRSGIAGVLVDAFTQAATLRLSNAITGNPLCIVPNDARDEMTIPLLVGWRAPLGTSSKKIPSPRPWYEDKGPWETLMTAICDGIGRIENIIQRRRNNRISKGGGGDVSPVPSSAKNPYHLTDNGNTVQIWLHVLSSNTGALKMYSRRGFKQRHCVRSFYNFCGKDHDALILSWSSSSPTTNTAAVTTAAAAASGTKTTTTLASSLRRLLGGSSLVDVSALEPYQFAESNLFSWISLLAVFGIVVVALALGGTFLAVIHTFKAQNEAYAATKKRHY